MASVFNNKLDRRNALAIMGSAGLGSLALSLTPLFADDSQGEALSKPLSKFSDQSRKRLLRLLKEPGFSGQVPASEVKEVAESEGKSIDTIMLELLPLARTYSRPPISNFHVGAVARGVSGNLYLGANVELPGHALGFSVHAEQAALSNSYMHADRGIVSIAVTAAPCGHCRQFMNELSPEGDIQVLIEGRPSVKLSSLLPQAFGPRDLGFKEGAFPVRETALILPKGLSDELAPAAFEAARKSYAPYSKAYSGIAIGSRSGRIYKGAYLENAAFNPSLSPLQTALVSWIVAGESDSEISKVTLVELQGASISQKSATEAVLSAISSTVKLHVVSASMKAS